MRLINSLLHALGDETAGDAYEVQEALKHRRAETPWIDQEWLGPRDD